MKKHTLTEILTMRKKRQKVIEKELGCKFIRINPDAESNYIIKLTKESTKKNLTENLSKTLLELEFTSNHLIKTKALRYVVNKILPSL